MKSVKILTKPVKSLMNLVKYLTKSVQYNKETSKIYKGTQ